MELGDGCSGGRRGLEVTGSEHPTESPAEVCTADWVAPPALPGEAAAQPFPESHAASTVVSLRFLTCLEKGCTALMLQAVEKGLGGHQAAGGEGLNILSQSCQPKCFIR